MEEKFQISKSISFNAIKTVLSSSRVALNSSTPLHPATIFIDRDGIIVSIIDHDTESMRQSYLSTLSKNIQDYNNLTQQVTIELKDYQNLLLMPGLIDCNANLQESAKEKWEGYTFGTQAAAAGGVTTLVDLPIMKQPTLTSLKHLGVHQKAAEQSLKVDVVFMAYLCDLNFDHVQQLIDEGTIFGFCSFLSAPLNRKLDEISEKVLLAALQLLCSQPNEILYYIEANASEGRHMYAKSPFRKEKLRQRLSQDIPKTLNLMAFAFPDGNEGDNSSDSEGESKPAILSIERLNPQSKEKGGMLRAPHTNTNRFEEPSSAMIREEIGQLRQDAQNLAISELMLYETNTSSEVKHQEETESSEDQALRKIHRPMMVPDNLNTSTYSDKQILVDSLIAVADQEETKEIEVKAITITEVSPDKPKIFCLSKEKIDFNAQPRQSQSIDTFKQSPTKLIIKNTSPTRNISISPHKQIQSESDSQETSSKDMQREQTIQHGNTLKPPMKRHGKSQFMPLTLQTKLSTQQNEETKQNCESGVSSLKSSPLLIGQTRGSGSKVNSPLKEGGSASRSGTSFIERRKQMMAKKRTDSFSIISSPELGQAQLTQDSSLQSPYDLPLIGKPLFAIKLIQAVDQKIEDNPQQEESGSPGVYNQLAPLNTCKKEENADTNTRLQQNYKFFLSLQPVSFEENGVIQVEKLLNQIENFSGKNCKLHFINFSSNVGLDKIRQLKKNPQFEGKITYEITPHHLMFTAADIQDKETKMKCCPPIRDQREQALLQLSFKKKYFDVITSQHFPVDPMYKNAGGGNFFKAFNGVSTLGFTLQAMWSIFKQRKNEWQYKGQNGDHSSEQELSQYVNLLVQVLSEQPAKLLGISSKKGTLEVGKQADIVVFDLDEEREVREEDIFNRFPEVCIYKGKKLFGKVKETYLRGSLVFSESDKSILESKFEGIVLRKADFHDM